MRIHVHRPSCYQFPEPATVCLNHWTADKSAEMRRRRWINYSTRIFRRKVRAYGLDADVLVVVTRRRICGYRNNQEMADAAPASPELADRLDEIGGVL